MPDPTSQPERIDLRRADDPRDIVHRAVACLAQGGVVALPTDAADCLAACALQLGAVARLLALAASDAPGTPALALRGPGELADWVPDLDETGRRLARRGWPGPLTLVSRGAVDRGLARRLLAEVRAAVVRDGALALCVPGHPLTREIGRLTSGPLVLAPTSRTDLQGLDMVIDDGPAPLVAHTVVALDPGGWRLLEAGAFREEDLVRMAGTMLLFVCTGNTCRSPMAAAICKRRLADRLGCAPDDLERRGFVVLSAGLAAAHGHPAAREAVDVVEVLGGSLRDHASQPLTPELVAAADLIVVMTRDHRHALLSQVPDAADRVRLLHPRGGDIADPIGLDRDVYHQTASEIAEHLDHILDELAI
ncbi:MAG TPA: Sua5/YciO/YrdC/YwlC family protein [Isosphaeraceae bacterium]|jgi:protein-tyrosine phosphatase|nr:Sua5/YciO/YrdC/YwlC family protein [Isosphaeraceae bacterium]